MITPLEPKSYNALLDIVRKIDPVLYAKTRNQLDGHVTGLSPYITRGVLTLPTVRDVVLERYSLGDSYKLIQELAWREYFQRVWEAKGDAIFEDVRFAQQPVEHEGVPQSIISATTGIDVIDREISQFYESGYLHNHSRLTIASLCCNLGRCGWREPSQWMYYHLLDGDPASNALSWQWVAGTSISKKYFVDQNLINHWSGSTQENTFLCFKREDTLDLSIPQELQGVQRVNVPVYLPTADTIDLSDGRDICVYHSFCLDPLWRKVDDVHRVLLIEPRWFEKMPVSQNVMGFIVRLAREMVPGISVVVQDFEAFTQSLSSDQKVFVRDHPSVLVWTNDQLIKDLQEWLFPEVQGYHKSFFAYWKNCEQYLEKMK